MEGPQTYSSSHIRRQREAHARADGYGRHRHLYLHRRIQQLAETLRQEKQTDTVTWLDYGCGKGGFIEQIRPFALFATITGYDPAVDAFSARPREHFDLVTCLDVIDIVEPRFLGALLDDVASLTGGLALFDCLTRPRRDSTLRPHPPFYWQYIVSQHMRVQQTEIEFPQLQDFERVVIIAKPQALARRG